MNYDVLIVSTNKDFHKLTFIYESIVKYLQPAFNKIYCICTEYPSERIQEITYILDKEVLDVDMSKVRYRPTWIYQQYLKLLQEVTLDNYLVIDADIILNKPIIVFENDTPNFLLGNSNHFKTFFRWLKEMFGLDREYSHSFINEIMLFNRNLIKEMILTKFNNKNDFITKSNSIISNTCFPSEYELYGNYIYKNHRNSYNYKRLNVLSSVQPGKWSVAEIEKYIEKYKDSRFDILSIPTYN